MVTVKVVQKIVKILNFAKCSSFSFIAWDHMGVNVSNDISSESTHQIHSQKLHTHM